ncbi:WD40-repeat-containing domain protein, partial [Dimargaris cristalligena]
PRKELCNYYAPWPVYALDWSKQPREQTFRLAVGSFLEQYNNKLQIIQYRGNSTAAGDNRPGEGAFPPPPGGDYAGPNHMAEDPQGTGTPRNLDFAVVAEADHPYPITKTQWAPYARGGPAGPDLIATAGDFLRLWEVQPSSQAGPGLQLKATLTNSKVDFCAPLTSFDWNELDLSRLVTCSIDTTCTLWDVHTQQPKTQLIAHDKEVYDVAFRTGSTDVFASAGADGSIRMFDLRDLEHSTIIYETPSSVPTAVPGAPGAAVGANPNALKVSPPLMRLAFNKQDPNFIATFGMDAASVQILDIRMPGIPVYELRGHRGSVNTLAWAPHQAHQLCTAGDDQQVLVWDIMPAGGDPSSSGGGLGSARPPGHHPDLSKSIISSPALTYTAPVEVNTVAWSRVVTEWVAIGFGQTVQTLRV